MKKAFILLAAILVLAVSVSCNEPKEPELLADGSIVLTSSMTTWNDGETYVLKRDVFFDRPGKRITVEGNVTLILNDGRKLYAMEGITVNNGSRLTIKGKGTLNAQNGSGENDSAIGGTSGKSCGEIIITEGTVKAYANCSGHSNCGAGIGGGYQGKGGVVKITGGTVYAKGGEYGAGIGGGLEANGGVVQIEGGSVYAEGGPYGDEHPTSGIGHGATYTNDGALELGNGIKIQVSDDGEVWSDYDGTTHKRFMKTN